MNILVTGCAGFIGSHLCEALLKKGYGVIGIDNFDPFYARSIKLQNLFHLQKNPRFFFYESDIRSKESLDAIKEDFTAVIHVAAKAGVRPSIEDPTGYCTTNIQGTLNIAEFARSRRVSKIVFASSSSVYGNNAKIPFSEQDLAVEPISPYAFTKRSCELLLYNYFHLYHTSSICLRFFTVYGPRQRPDLAIHKFFKAIYNDTPIQVFGDGNTYRDYTFIDDIIYGIIASLEYIGSMDKLYEIINLGNHQPVSLINLIRSIEQVIGKKAILQYTGMQPGDVEKTYADVTKAKNLLGFIPRTRLEDGLSAFNDWYVQTLEKATI